MVKYDNVNYEYKNILGKKVFIVERHNYVLPFWAYESNKKPCSLVSLDYHTDTVKMFRDFADRRIKKISKRREVVDRDYEKERIIKNRFKKIKLNDYESLYNAVLDLDNDEHIVTAYNLGILKDFHVINCVDCVPIEKGENLYKLEAHDLVFDRFRSFGLEDDLLKLIKFKIPNDDIILDFDLDFFPARKSFKPFKYEIVKELINKAQVITIAREKYYFDKLKIEKDFSVDEAENMLLQFIEKCVS